MQKGTEMDPSSSVVDRGTDPPPGPVTQRSGTGPEHLKCHVRKKGIS